jgi:hypothetical protein
LILILCDTDGYIMRCRQNLATTAHMILEDRYMAPFDVIKYSRMLYIFIMNGQHIVLHCEHSDLSTLKLHRTHCPPVSLRIESEANEPPNRPSSVEPVWRQLCDELVPSQLTSLVPFESELPV